MEDLVEPLSCHLSDTRYHRLKYFPLEEAFETRPTAKLPAPGGVVGKPEDAPSEFAAVHGYVLEPEIFDVLERAKPGRNGEIWLTDAVSELARAGAPVWAVELQGTRYDTGDKLGYVKAFIDAALRREDLAPLLRAHLKESGWRAPGER